MKKLLTVTILIIVTALLSGCIGAGPILTRTTEEIVSVNKNPQYDSKLYSYPCLSSKEIGDPERCYPRSLEFKKLQKNSTILNLEEKEVLKQDIINIWGKPKSSGLTDDGKYYYMAYNRGIAWRGFAFIIGIIPLPLAVPVGQNKTYLFFENKILASIVKESGDAYIFICGYHGTGPDSPGCKIGW